MAAPAGNGMYVVTHYIPTANICPAQQVASPCQQPNFLKRFIEGEPKTLGAIQIMVGILHICLGAFVCVIPGTLGSTIILSGVPFWASASYIISGALSVAAERNGTLSLYIIPGALSVAAGRNSTLSLMKASLGMNIVSIVFSGIEIIIVSIDLGVDSPIRCPFGFCSVRQGVVSVLLILSVLEFCLAFSTSVFGCKSVCCSGDTMESQPVLAVQQNYSTASGNTVGQPAGMPVPYTVSSTPAVPPYHGEAQAQGLPAAPETTTPPNDYMKQPGHAIQS
ncbi:membrane-spanning 4-domains subfamily A member 15-like [Pleurodeles waltl]